MSDQPISQLTRFTPLGRMLLPVVDPAAPPGLKNGNVTVQALLGQAGAGASYVLPRLPPGALYLLTSTNLTPPGTVTLAASTIFFQPFSVPNAITLSQAGVLVTTPAAGTASVGIYANNPAATYDQPGSLLGVVAGLNTAAAGPAAAALNTQVQLLPNTIYWVGVLQSGAASLAANALAAASASLGYVTGLGAVSGYSLAGTALPNPAIGSFSAVVSLPPLVLAG